MKFEKVGVICAMELEAREIRRSLSQVREEKAGSLVFFVGKLGRREVILGVCGIGKVFAAMCAQTMILKYSPDCIVNSGVAGSLSEELEILDVAVSESLVQHDVDTSPLGDPVGYLSGLDTVRLPAEEALRSALLSHARSLGIRAMEGCIATGDQFIATAEKKRWIRETFSPIACEMEGGAIAQVALANAVPFCAVRAISDSFSGKNEMDYARFAPEAARRGAALLVAFLAEDFS